MATTTSNSNGYSANGYAVSLDNWGVGDQTDYTNSATYNPSTFPTGVDFAWSFPLSDVGAVQAYPHISYQPTNSAGAPLYPSVSDINLSATYNFSISGATQDFDVAWDLWLNNSAGKVLDEVLIMVHAPTGWPMSNQPEKLTDTTLTNADIYTTEQSSGGASWQYIAVQTTADQLSGTISISDVLKELIWDGLLTGNEYLTSTQVGAEAEGGAGGLNVNSLSYSMQSNSTVQGTGGTDTLSNNGSNLVLGNGSDTAVFSSDYASYQIKESGSEVLITYNGNISTLDVLEGVANIKFANGTYNVANETFTPTGSNSTTTSDSNSGSTTTSDSNSGSTTTSDSNAGSTTTGSTTGVGTTTGGAHASATTTYSSEFAQHLHLAHVSGHVWG